MSFYKSHISLLFASIFILFAGSAFAQTEVDEQLALQFYQNKEYDKAADLYQNIYDAKPTPFYYDYYLNCLFELQDYKRAKKFVAKVARQNPKNIKYKVEEAYILQRSGNTSKAEKNYNKIIKSADDNRRQYVELSEAFAARNLNAFAVKTLIKGKKKRIEPPLNMELALLYYKIGNDENMVKEYLDLAVSYDKYIDVVKSRLQLIITDPAKDKSSEALRTELLRRTQKYKNETIYSELLYWYSVQKKDFELALIQAKALDVQFRENGERVFNLANILMSNKEWALAVDAYNFIIDIGPESIFYMNAEMRILDAKFNKIIEDENYTQEEILSLEGDYKMQLRVFGKNAGTSQMIMNLAKLQAFYLSDLESAKELLSELQNIPNISKKHKAEAKLQLGDIKLFSGEKWSASLLYKQVEKENKNEPTGYLAKFKAAQFYYYVGEMEWAKSQLDVLRGATSKLIANNSMELYLLIQENISADSSYDALSMYAQADLLQYQKKYDLANMKLDTILNIFPHHPITDDVYFKKAMIAMDEKKFLIADSLFELTADYNPFGPLADNSLIERARLNDFSLNNKAKAKEIYQKILLDYPGSLFTVEARKRYREMEK
ncbi:MAG: hypothetical protein B6I18_00440 [Bacteroidetes bacterium 4572_112]|nr:MAG: hypothetical protein B6I18_00440 [Bacteroidetes bacterium 4572_112]